MISDKHNHKFNLIQSGYYNGIIPVEVIACKCGLIKINKVKEGSVKE